MQNTSGNSPARTFRNSHSSGAQFFPLLAFVLTLLGLPTLVTAQAPNVAYNGPLNITKGGTYSGNYRSTDSNTPVIRISTSEPVVIENSVLAGAGDIIWANNGAANLTIRNNKAYGLTPSEDNRGRGRFVAASSAKNLYVEANYLENTAGFTIYQWSGDGSTSQTLKILRNQVKNIDGRHRSGNGFTMSNFVGLNTVRNLSNIEIAWNQVMNEPDKSSVEDNINFYNSGGTSNSPARVHDNYVQGAYPIPATNSVFSGTGMTTDGDGNTAGNTAAFVQAYNNQFVSVCNAAMNIAAGHDIRYYNNRMVTSGMLPDGRKLNGTYAATAIFNAYQMPGSVMYNNSIDNNTIGFVKWGYTIPFADRHDLSAGACASCTSTNHLPNPITLQTEENEWTLWQQKLKQNGVAVGPNGSGATAPAPAPTPIPTPTPTPTPSTPVAGPIPSGATFVRAINVNGGATSIDGKAWEAGNSASGVSINGSTWDAQNVTLNPATDAARASMIRSMKYGSNLTANVNVSNGTYQVYTYVWEDNSAQTFSITLEGKTVQSNYNSGSAGHWDRLGPFTAVVTDGNITLNLKGGDANLSGIEIWKQDGTTTTPAPTTPTAPIAPTTPAAPATAGFYRAINLNGNATSIDGNAWEGRNAANYTTNGATWDAQNVTLKTTTDAARASMIRSMVYSQKLSFTMTAVPNGDYDVYAYIWEDNDPQIVSLTVNGQPALTNYNTGSAGTWKKVGPFAVTVTNGTIQLNGSGGDLNLSGVEVWKKSSTAFLQTPAPATQNVWNTAATQQQVAAMAAPASVPAVASAAVVLPVGHSSVPTVATRVMALTSARTVADTSRVSAAALLLAPSLT